MSVAVQFYGIDNVVKAFEYKKISTWAIFQGSALLHKCEGVDDMEKSAEHLFEYLEMISTGDSGAVYKLKVYEGADKVNEKTGCDGSFNFRLYNEEARQQRKENYSQGRNTIIDRLDKIEQMLNDDDGEDEEEPEQSFGEKIGSMFLADPTKLPLIISSLSSALQLLLPTKQQPPAQQHMRPVYAQPQQQPPSQLQPVNINDYGGYPAAISGIEEPDELTKAIDTLKKNDPKITEHLSKLAKMSEDNKQTFNYLLTILDSM